jgi:adenylate kinase
MAQQTNKQWRTLPNILITGTPGTGKTCLSESLLNEFQSKSLSYEIINVSEVAKSNGFVEREKDVQRDTFVLDEDRLLDWMEEKLGSDRNKGFIVEYHSSELFPERWFDLVIVLRTDTKTLYQRLSKRGYHENKVRENVECEIYNICEEEARESYQHDIVKVYDSNTIEDIEHISEQILNMVKYAISHK